MITIIVAMVMSTILPAIVIVLTNDWDSDTYECKLTARRQKFGLNKELEMYGNGNWRGTVNSNTGK